jgi:hypothetical protein
VTPTANVSIARQETGVKPANAYRARGRHTRHRGGDAAIRGRPVAELPDVVAAPARDAAIGLERAAEVALARERSRFERDVDDVHRSDRTAVRRVSAIAWVSAVARVSAVAWVSTIGAGGVGAGAVRSRPVEASADVAIDSGVARHEPDAATPARGERARND